MIANVLLLVAHADGVKSDLPIKALHHRGDHFVKDTHKPFHIYLVRIGIGKFIIERPP